VWCDGGLISLLFFTSLETVNVKRQPVGPRPAHHVSSKYNVPETVYAVAYEGRYGDLQVILDHGTHFFFSFFSSRVKWV
jgi:hypothetical protein